MLSVPRKKFWKRLKLERIIFLILSVVFICISSCPFMKCHPFEGGASRRGANEATTAKKGRPETNMNRVLWAFKVYLVQGALNPMGRSTWRLIKDKSLSLWVLWLTFFVLTNPVLPYLNFYFNLNWEIPNEAYSSTVKKERKNSLWKEITVIHNDHPECTEKTQKQVKKKWKNCNVAENVAVRNTTS
jgi:hypothetical protein